MNGSLPSNDLQVGKHMKSQEQLYDELLVLRCQHHDAAAFDELVRRWQQRLWRYAYHRTGREDIAWDMVQETWVAVVKGILRLEDVASFPRWIYRILNNRCADATRKQVRERQLQQRIANDASNACMLEPNGKKSTGALQALIERLPPDQRALLVLRYAEGFDIREIAMVLDIPEGTVKSRLFHAKQKLKEGLERERQRT
jgi:RNA polymerase sigma-70 factor (ECF subfamily)